MAKQEFTKTIRQTMTAGFLKALINRLADFRDLMSDALKW